MHEMIALSDIFPRTYHHSQRPRSRLAVYGNKQANQLVTLAAEQRKATEQALQNTVYELIALHHAVQQAHWNVVGPLFYSLHDLLGHLYKNLNGFSCFRKFNVMG